MKKILITGKDSYIGISLEQWLMREPDNYQVDTVDMKDESWKEKDFSEYDTVFHVAGIAHVKETQENHDLYQKINRDLAFETAMKAKQDGVTHFIFLSSMSVYGVEKGVITESTTLRPKTAYGKSKMEAEALIRDLQTDSFTIAVLRPPMVYGKGCKGNYPRLAGFALKIPIFPNIDNKRSMVYIDNLTEFVKILIDQKKGGLFFPQNTEYVNTSEMVRLIAEIHGKKMMMTKFFNPILRIMNISTVNKLFGDLVYDKKMASNISLVGFVETIKKTEKVYGE